MYCHQCGVEIPEPSRFCSSCGTEQAARGRSASAGLAGSTQARTPAEPVVTLEPAFVPGLQMVRQGLFALFFAVWGGGFLGGFSLVILQSFGLGLPTWAPFAFFGAAFALGVPYWSYRRARSTYEQTKYTFHPERLDYHEGFTTVEAKSIPLDCVTEVHLSRGPLQSKHGLGTLLLSTPATSAGHNSASAAIRLLDIDEPDAAYHRVKELVERSRTGRARPDLPRVSYPARAA